MEANATYILKLHLLLHLDPLGQKLYADFSNHISFFLCMSFQLQMKDLCLSFCLTRHLASKNGLTNICSKQQKTYGLHWPKMAVCLLKEKTE